MASRFLFTCMYECLHEMDREADKRVGQLNPSAKATQVRFFFFAACKTIFFWRSPVAHCSFNADKICDQVSDAILDACLKEDPWSKVACETAAKTGMVSFANRGERGPVRTPGEG